MMTPFDSQWPDPPATKLPEPREPERQSVVSECMMTDAEHDEVEALAGRVFASPTVGDLSLLAIRVLERGAQVERLEREADEGEKELNRLRLEVELANLRHRKLRAAIEAGATDATQAEAKQLALVAIENGDRIAAEGICPSDVVAAGVGLASAYLAAAEELKAARAKIAAGMAALAGEVTS